MAPRTAETADPSTISDLVLEGGGVKGIGLVGALTVLHEAGWGWVRIAGTSAGALVGSVLVALQRNGESLERLEEIARTLDYSRFLDRGRLGRLLGPLGFIADGYELLTRAGAYNGEYLSDWLGGVLGDLGVRTFGDLRLEDPAGDGTLAQQYALVVTASDVSRRRLVHFPWDCAQYDLVPDEMSVVEAVRASASTPYLFEPVQLSSQHGTSTLVDGGLISNYPIDIFDRADERRPRWPTIGIRLDSLGLSQHTEPVQPIGDPIRLGIALIETAVEGWQSEHVLEPCNLSRSIYVDTSAVSAFDFDLDDAQRQDLLDQGRSAAEEFLRHWDYERWLRQCRGVAP